MNFIETLLGPCQPGQVPASLQPIVQQVGDGLRSTIQSSIRETIPQVPRNLPNVYIDQTGSGTFLLIDGEAGITLEFYEILLQFNNGGDVIFYSADKQIFPMRGIVAGDRLFLNFTGEPHFACSPSEPLRISLATSGNVGGYIKYFKRR